MEHKKNLMYVFTLWNKKKLSLKYLFTLCCLQCSFIIGYDTIFHPGLWLKRCSMSRNFTVHVKWYSLLGLNKRLFTWQCVWPTPLCHNIVVSASRQQHDCYIAPLWPVKKVKCRFLILNFLWIFPLPHGLCDVHTRLALGVFRTVS